jgi:glucose/arabinose dehydrogenase
MKPTTSPATHISALSANGLHQHWAANPIRPRTKVRSNYFVERLKKLAGFVLVAGTMLYPAGAATLPNGFTESLVAGGISSPTAMEFAPDGRLFVSQQAGQLRVIKNGSLLAAPFLSVTVDSSVERGLLGIAFDPGFAVNHYVYVYYTATTPAVHNRVSRFTAAGDIAVAGSEMVILDLNNLSAAGNHNGGGLHFGSDGKLYITAGENANSANSQTLGNLLGKILRLNADGSIPTDNPFYNTASGVNRAIWAMGLRNPFTFAVQPGTGRIFLNDVGENTWEEINEAAAGANYGWPNCEGVCSPANPSYRDPLFRYPHGTGTSAGNAIAGGAFYNPATFQFPGTYAGSYFFGDYVNGWIRRLDPANGNQVGLFATGISSPVDLKVGADGRLYYLARGSGAVYAISYIASQAPLITQQPVDQTVRIGQPATFTVTASGTAPLGYRWQRNGAWVSGATSSSYTLASATAGDDGAGFRCAVTNAYGAVTSNPALLHLTGDNPPVGAITLPANGSLYTAGGTIQYAATATDAEDGRLPASAFSWSIVFHHDTHTHPFLGPINGMTNGSFVIPTQGETSANVWYRIHLDVTDSAGQTQDSFVDVLPRTANVSLTTSPPGLQLTLDGQPRTTPVSVSGVVGMNRTLGVVSPQTLNGTNYTFASWSDGGAATHGIIWPAANTTFAATYQVAAAGGSLFADDFTRATNPGPLSPWVAAMGTWSVSDGMLNGSSTAPNYGYASVNNSWTDYSVEGRVRFPLGGFGGGLGGRLNAASGAHYAAWVYPEGSAGGSRLLKLKKHSNWTSWSGTPMQQVTLANVGTNWHTLKIIFSGPRIQVLFDGSQALDVSDVGFDGQAAYLSGGINAGLFSASGSSSMSVDDVVVKALSNNQPPVAINDSYSVVAGAILNVNPPGVLGNDTDANGNALTAALVNGPGKGTLNLSINGGFTYTPTAGYSGPDSFTYKANDGTADSGVATVSLTVTTSGGNTLFADDFTRATNPGPLSPWVAAMSTWSVSSGMLNGSSTAPNYGFACVNNSWTDYSVEGRVRFPVGAFGGGLGGRMNAASGAHYAAWVYPEGSAGGSRLLKLKKHSNWTTWSGTPMQQVTLANVGTNWHTLKIIFSGPRIQVLFDGSQAIDVSDAGFDGQAAYLSGGINAGLFSASGSSSMSLDDVVVSALGSLPPVVPPSHITIDSIIVSPDGQVHLTLRALAGQTFVVQASTDLLSWEDLGMVDILDDLSAEFVDLEATQYQHRYYRAKLFTPAATASGVQIRNGEISR